MDFPFHFGCSLGPPATTRDATSPCCPSCSPGVAPRPGTAPLVFPHSSCYAGTPRPLGCESPSGAAAGWCGGGMWSGGGVSSSCGQHDGQTDQKEDIELKDLSWRTKDGGEGGGATPVVAETNIQEVCGEVASSHSARQEVVCPEEETPEDVAMTTTTATTEETYEHYYYDLGDADDLDDDDSDEIDAGPTDPIFFNPDGSIEVAFSDSEAEQLQDFISLLPHHASPPSPPPPPATMSPTAGVIVEKHGRSVSFSPVRSVRPLLVGDNGSCHGSDSTTNSMYTTAPKCGQTLGMSSSASKGMLTSRSANRGRMRSRSVPQRALGPVALPFESEPYVQRLREEGKLRAEGYLDTQDPSLGGFKTQFDHMPSSTVVEAHTGRLPFSPHDSRMMLAPCDNQKVHSSSSKCSIKESRLSLSIKSSPPVSTNRRSSTNSTMVPPQDSSSMFSSQQERRTGVRAPERPKSILLPRIDGSLRSTSDSRVRFTDSTLQAALAKSGSHTTIQDRSSSPHSTSGECSDRRHLQIRVRMLSNSSERLGGTTGEKTEWVQCQHSAGEEQPLPSEWMKATGKPRPHLKGCRRSLSMEDAIIDMANHPQEKEPFRLRRTNSTDRITKHLRAKLGLPVPTPSITSEPGTSSISTPISIPKGGMRRQCTRTVSSRLPLLPSQHRRVTSFSAVHTVSRSVGEETSSLVPLHECCRCHLNCTTEEGDFTCSGCSALQRVRNAFLVEVYSDRSPSGPPSSSCYGVRVGLGLVPLVVALLSLVVCSFILLSDTVLGSACDIFCREDRQLPEHRTQSDGMFDWMDRSK